MRSWQKLELKHLNITYTDVTNALEDILDKKLEFKEYHFNNKKKEKYFKTQIAEYISVYITLNENNHPIRLSIIITEILKCVESKLLVISRENNLKDLLSNII